MVDEEITDLSAGPTGAPVNRDARREPDVIEAEIAGRDADESVSSPDPTASETRPNPRPAARAAPRNGARSLLAGARGGGVASARCRCAGPSRFASQTHRA